MGECHAWPSQQQVPCDQCPVKHGTASSRLTAMAVAAAGMAAVPPMSDRGGAAGGAGAAPGGQGLPGQTSASNTSSSSRQQRVGSPGGLHAAPAPPGAAHGPRAAQRAGAHLWRRPPQLLPAPGPPAQPATNTAASAPAVQTQHSSCQQPQRQRYQQQQGCRVHGSSSRCSRRCRGRQVCRGVVAGAGQ